MEREHSAPTTKGKSAKGRLPRRTPEEIAKTLDLVVGILKGTRGKGLRSEEIQKALNAPRRLAGEFLDAGMITDVFRALPPRMTVNGFGLGHRRSIVPVGP